MKPQKLPKWIISILIIMTIVILSAIKYYDHKQNRIRIILSQYDKEMEKFNEELRNYKD